MGKRRHGPCSSTAYCRLCEFLVFAAVRGSQGELTGCIQRQQSVFRQQYVGDAEAGNRPANAAVLCGDTAQFTVVEIFSAVCPIEKLAMEYTR